jgi:hypothetical protein
VNTITLTLKATVSKVKPKAAPKDKTLDVYARALTRGFKRAASGERYSLRYAVEAGELCIKVKEYLATHPLVLQNFTQWFAAIVEGFSQRTAPTYQRVSSARKVFSHP